jgi:hypothetical protein
MHNIKQNLDQISGKPLHDMVYLFIFGPNYHHFTSSQNKPIENFHQNKTKNTTKI